MTKNFFPKLTKEKKEKKTMADPQTKLQDQQPPKPATNAKPGPQVAPTPKDPVTIDHLLASLSRLPLMLDEDNEEIKLSTKSFALVVVGVLEIDDASLLRAILRRRRVGSRFEEVLNAQE